MKNNHQPVLLGNCHNLKRTYTFEAFEEGPGFAFVGVRYFMSDMRIRQTAVVLFKKWFGRVPTKSWGQDGFMAEAWDKRGHRISLYQENWKHHQ